LQCTSPALNDDYIALSYVWGRGRTLRTTTDTFDDHLSCIEMQALPQTIQDAVHVTRQLCVKFLWVDALCIIQDSERDKVHELARMHRYYRNALVVISAAGAANADEGFLHFADNQLATTAWKSPADAGKNFIVVPFCQTCVTGVRCESQACLMFSQHPCQGTPNFRVYRLPFLHRFNRHTSSPSHSLAFRRHVFSILRRRPSFA
jgi:hypothetical protein